MVLEKNAQSIVDRKENQFRHYKYSKRYKKAYEQHQEKTSIIARPCDEKGKARAFVNNRKDRREKKQRSSHNTNTRRYSRMAGKKHCGDVCGCKRSQKVEGHDRLRLQQTRQLMMMTPMYQSLGGISLNYSVCRMTKNNELLIQFPKINYVTNACQLIRVVVSGPKSELCIFVAPPGDFSLMVPVCSLVI